MNMSFMLTVDAMRQKTKTVTRRLGWWTLEPGTIITAVERSQGLKRGEKVKVIGKIKVVSLQLEPLREIYERGWRETAREGFPQMQARAFVKMFCEHNKCLPETLVNRIEFEHL